MMPKKLRFLKDNGLTIVLFSLFAICLVAQSLTGLAAYNETQVANSQPVIGYWQYVGSGTFLDGVFENWQAAILQLFSLIVLGIFLAQRGATHSREPGELTKRGSRRKRSVWTRQWLHNNSLSIVFFALFLFIFVAHLLAGLGDYNHERSLSHQGAVTVRQFLVSSKFWFVTFQTWEAEYVAIGMYLVLSIFLRQEGSPESKPVHARNIKTGRANE